MKASIVWMCLHRPTMSKATFVKSRNYKREAGKTSGSGQMDHWKSGLGLEQE